VAKVSKTNEVGEPSADGVDDKELSSEAALVEIPHSLSVRQLAALLQVSVIDVIKRLMRNGIMANINQVVDYETAAAVVAEFGYKVAPKPRRKAGRLTSSEIKKRQLQEGELGGLKPRPPVVTIMGHIDHGKTKLLDAIRQANVAATEAGGITQHIGAYQVEVSGQKSTFLDTPGHEAFTAMRAHGAQVTDIAILVVAADDGVMPQTLEALDHARAAGVPIVVAINKIDKPHANPEQVKKQLADAGLLIEEWGGETVCCLVSAKEKKGIAELLENLLVVAEIEELRANPSQSAVGVVIEAKMDKAKGPLATVLVNTGTLRLGDTVVTGNTWGRVRAMFNDVGKRVRKAGPSTPVEIMGLNEVPRAGDTLRGAAGEHQARALIQKRQQETEQALIPKSVTLSSLSKQISAGNIKELNIVLKTDVQGSIEPIISSLQQLSTEEVKVRVIHAGTGNVVESDVLLAIASKALVIGFATGSEAGARRLAEAEGVGIRHYDVIYSLVDDVYKALKGMLEPSYVEVTEGQAEVRAIFASSKKDGIAGVYVTEGKARRNASVRVWRGEKMVIESVVGSLRRFKDDVQEVATGYECGVGIKDFSQFEVGDRLEFFKTEKVD